MDHLHRTVEQFVEALPHDRVRLSAANFHERPRTGGRLADALDQWKCDGRVAVLGEVLHSDAVAGALDGTAPSSAIQSSSSCLLISRSTSNVRCASTSSTFEMAKPTCTIT